MDNLRSYIRAVILERIRPSTFSLNKLKQLPWSSVAGSESKLSYVSKNLLKIGTGSSRIAFQYSSSYILKVAKNNKGLLQNKQELDVYTHPETKNIVAKIADYDPNYAWLMSEIVKPIKSNVEFFKHLGLDPSKTYNINGADVEFHQLGDLTGLLFEDNIPVDVVAKNLPEKVAQKLRALVTIVENHVLSVLDIEVLDHWGVTAGGELVILDYGLGEVSREAYK